MAAGMPLPIDMIEEATGVVPLRAVQPPAPDQDMIDMLERFLQRAKDGEMNFLACVCTFKDTGAIAEGYVKRETAHNYTILGAIESMKIGFARGHTNKDDFEG